MLRILKDLINRLFVIKSKEIKKPKLKLIVENGDKNKEIYCDPKSCGNRHVIFSIFFLVISFTIAETLL